MKRGNKTPIMLVRCKIPHVIYISYIIHQLFYFCSILLQFFNIHIFLVNLHFHNFIMLLFIPNRFVVLRIHLSFH